MQETFILHLMFEEMVSVYQLAVDVFSYVWAFYCIECDVCAGSGIINGVVLYMQVYVLAKMAHVHIISWSNTVICKPHSTTSWYNYSFNRILQKLLFLHSNVRTLKNRRLQLQKYKIDKYFKNYNVFWKQKCVFVCSLFKKHFCFQPTYDIIRSFNLIFHKEWINTRAWSLEADKKHF